MDCSRSLQGLLLVLIASATVVAPSEARTLVVGDAQGWRAGTNYTAWAIQNSPFSIDDVLVFKYPPPSKSSVAQSVHLLPKLWSFITCDFSGAKLLGSATQGSDHGFQVVLNEWKPYYFASAEGNRYDCIAGLTKFIVVPFPRWH